jgi:hypothetical protein
MSSLPQTSSTVAVQSVTTVSPLQIFDVRTVDEQWFAGFNQYADCMRDGEYLSAEEFDAMTPVERKGYRDAISAADYAEWSAYHESTNAYGDLCQGGMW